MVKGWLVYVAVKHNDSLRRVQQPSIQKHFLLCRLVSPDTPKVQLGDSLAQHLQYVGSFIWLHIGPFAQSSLCVGIRKGCPCIQGSVQGCPQAVLRASDFCLLQN